MSVTAAHGFSAGTASTGLRATGLDDVCVFLSDPTSVAAGVFTTNQMASPAITQARAAVADGVLRAVVVNAGNANACTGAQGLADARATAARAASVLGIEPEDVAVASTGVIGVLLDMAATLPAVESAAGSLDADGGHAASRAIMTTDSFAKESSVQVPVGDITYTVGGMAKGAGMIRPDMATMLCFITTDAPLGVEACRTALSAAVDLSFNRITVDGETSTNDLCLLLANGAAGGGEISQDDPAFELVADAVRQVAQELAKMIVRDGEGATKFVEVIVSGATDSEDAQTAANAVAGSLLFKCALFGEDANWGRVVSAVGASRARVDPDLIGVRFAGVPVAAAGTAVSFDEQDIAVALARDEIVIEIDLGIGDGSAVVWTCDLSYEYVRINAEYRS